MLLLDFKCYNINAYTIILSYYHTIIPSYHHTIIPSYYHTIIHIGVRGVRRGGEWTGGHQGEIVLVSTVRTVVLYV
jgi:hypothetical protein